VDQPVRVLHDPLEPVLGEQHGQTEVVDQSLQRGEDLFGGRWVQGRGRLVQHQDRRVCGEHRADRDPLALPAGQGRQRPGAQVGETEQVEGLLHPPAHQVGCEPQRLHPVGEFVLDDVGDEPGLRVLADHPDDVGELARWMRGRVPPGDRDPPASVPPVKWGTSPLTARRRVDLPEPVRPTTRHSSPSGTCRSTVRRVGAGASG
jgi:hypothetical protein